MELSLQTQDTLHELRAKADSSPILPVVLPLFESLERSDTLQPVRVSQSKDGAQLLWEVGEVQGNNFERICLTLSQRSLSLTVALDHYHPATENVPTIPRPVRAQPDRSTLVVEPAVHRLFETHRTRAHLLGTYENEEAIARFTPDLTHTLAYLGLRSYMQQDERQVG